MRNRAAGLLLSAVLGLPALAPRDARAVVGGSPHDIVAQQYGAAADEIAKEQCTPCHLPSGPVETRGFPDDIPPSLQEWDKASLMCFSCHDGTTIVSPHVDASASAFHPLSHGLDLGGLPDAKPKEGALPSAGTDRMGCGTCHDPHDNTTRPFLQLPVEEICLVCHGPLAPSPGGRETEWANHPLPPVAEPGRDAVPLSVNDAFKVGFPKPYPLKGGREASGVHWSRGGHLGEGEKGTMLCVTCHPVHGTEGAPPLPGLLPLDPVRDRADMFCEGCHKGRRGDSLPEPPFPNPGGTSTAGTYHPGDDATRKGEERIITADPPPGWPLGGGGEILCTTCHTPHRGRAGTPILRPQTEARTFCAECHHEIPDYHHPQGAISDARCSIDVPPQHYETPSGELLCSACHRAHNAGLGTGAEGDYVPLLRYRKTQEDFCYRCHPEGDPTCLALKGHSASHFMGNPSLPTTYGDDDPPLWTDPWPESGLASQFGDEKGKKIVTCYSCHAFRQGAVVSGDDGTAGHLLARSGNPVEWEPEAETTYLCTGCHTANPDTDKAGGHTHPLMDADTTRLSQPPLPPVTATAEGHINCDSCHRPHGAVDSGGYYIMEVVDGPNTDPGAIRPVIDYTVICHRCHSESEY